jgi:hypothetical protein
MLVRSLTVHVVDIVFPVYTGPQRGVGIIMENVLADRFHSY